MWKVRLELMIRVILWRIKINVLPVEFLDEEEQRVKEALQRKKGKKFMCGM